MLLSNHVVCGSKKTRLIKKKEVIGLLSSLGIRTHLNRIPLIGPLLF